MKTDRRFDAYQQFVLDTKLYWSSRMYPAVKSDYHSQIRQLAEQGHAPPTDADAVQALLGPQTLYAYYAWFERHLQRMKYSGHRGLAPHHARYREEIEARLEQADATGLLELNPRLSYPAYFTSFDVHQHPGGLWSDPIAGVVYERGARSTTPLLKRHADLHERLTEAVFKTTRPHRLIDLGCGFGKSTAPFYLASPELDITAIDLSEPCLRLAAITAHGHAAQRVRFAQRDCAATGYADASFDTVTSTMLLHELPPDHLRRMLAESYRLLEPGGIAVHLDFLVPTDDAFACFIHYTHGRRNNEPYMRPLNEIGLSNVLRETGFREIEIHAFEEAPGTLAPNYTAWRFPWTLVTARK
jgi:ubiquinone/menaquinone biosynthesis C-methylase UbiE